MASSLNHWLFQLANLFLFLSYGSKDVLLLRLLLMGAGVSFVLWGWLVLAVSVDTVVWNSLFTVINAARAMEVAWSRRPIVLEREEHEEMYTELFQPVGIGRLAFRSLMEQGLMRKIRAGTTFLEAGNDANNLTLIYSGTMNIISAPQDGRPPEPVGFVARMQFVESPQWANMQILQQQRKSKKKCTRLTTTSSGMDLSARPEQAPPAAGTAGTVTIGDEEEGGAGIGDTLLAVDDEDVRAAATVQVTFQAATDIVYYTWPMERLNEFLCRNPGLLAPVNALVGADVASKLFGQSATKKGDISALHRRVYLPMDQPSDENTSETPLVPVPLDDDGENETVRTSAQNAPLLVMSSQSTSDDETLKKHHLENLEDKNDKSSFTIRRSPLQAEQLWLERRGARDTANDKQLATFLSRCTCLNKYELSALLAKGRWRNILRPGTVVIREGEPTKSLSMVLTGTLSASKEEEKRVDAADGPDNGSGGVTFCKLHDILPGQMIGSIEFNEPEREHLAGETVTSLESCTYMEWDLDDLRELLGPRPRLRAQLTVLVAADVAAKFRQVEKSVRS